MTRPPPEFVFQNEFILSSRPTLSAQQIICCCARGSRGGNYSFIYLHFIPQTGGTCSQWPHSLPGEWIRQPGKTVATFVFYFLFFFFFLQHITQVDTSNMLSDGPPSRWTWKKQSRCLDPRTRYQKQEVFFCRFTEVSPIQIVSFSVCLFV